MVRGDVVNQLHNDDSLPYTCTTEKSNLSPPCVRSKKIYNLDTSDKNILGFTLFNEARCSTMKRRVFSFASLEDRSFFVHGFANNVDDSAKSFCTYRHLNGSSGIMALLPAHKTIRAFHSNGSYSVLSKMLSYLEYKAFVSFGDIHLESVENLGKTFVKLNVDNGSNDLSYSSCTHGSNSAPKGAIDTNLSDTASSKHGY
mmetsp:Transcript_5205/g.7677  ORF Transcript_5205/g.7677 Transcript_5205/m.7677 type:complete len:200 (+) Transcript_5205:1152-1751(+)